MAREALLTIQQERIGWRAALTVQLGGGDRGRVARKSSAYQCSRVTSFLSLALSNVANPQSVQDVIAREQNALAAETRIAGCPPYVAANDLNEVLETPRIFRAKHPARMRALAGAKGAAFVVACPSLGSSALWVGTENRNYRQDYLTFLNVEYGLNLTGIPRPFDVDHLYNQARGTNYKLRYLRTALVAHAVNRSHGAGPEKDVTTNEELRERGSGLKLMDEIACMKYFGFLPPLRSDPRDEEIDAYAIFAAAKLGLDAAEVRDSIRYLRKKASTPWARRVNG